MPVTIRHAGPGDEPAVVRLVRELASTSSSSSPVDERSVRRFLANPTCGVLLAVDDDEAVGALGYATVPSLFHAGDSGEIDTLIVTAARRREGIGRQLLATAIHLLEEAGCAEISIDADADNEVAQRLYVSMGLDEASVLLEKHTGL